MTTRSVPAYHLYEAAFSSHYQAHRDEHGGSYDQYRPAYRYSYGLGTHEHYGHDTWELIEVEARTYWEARNPGTWEQFNHAIHYAWTLAAGKRYGRSKGWSIVHA